jgi:prepilin-type N-terminal cleavage/methylation domain-containing protein
MKAPKAFTLIELLVVIAVIAILMAILIPVLGTAKKQATMARCLANHRNLLIGWITYADDNDVGGQQSGHSYRHRCATPKLGYW